MKLVEYDYHCLSCDAWIEHLTTMDMREQPIRCDSRGGLAEFSPVPQRSPAASASTQSMGHDSEASGNESCAGSAIQMSGGGNLISNNIVVGSVDDDGKRTPGPAISIETVRGAKNKLKGNKIYNYEKEIVHREID